MLAVEAFYLSTWSTGLEIVTDMVINATNIFSLTTKNSGLVVFNPDTMICDIYIIQTGD